MAIVTGTANVHNTVSAQLERDIENDVISVFAEEGKLSRFIQMTNEGKAMGTTVEWITSEHPASFTTIRVTNNSSALTIELTDPGIFNVGDIIMHQVSGETARVSAVNHHPTTPTVTLESRSRGDNAAATWTAADYVFNLGGAKDDGDDVSEAQITTETIYTNYVQTYFKSVDFTGTQIQLNKNGMIYGGDFIERKRRQTLLNIMEQHDQNALFGEAALSAGVGSETVRTLGGLRSHIASANTATIATLTESAFQNYMAQRPKLRMGKGGDSLTLICSDQGAVGLNTWTASKIQLDAGKSEYGFAMAKYVTPIGTVNIMPHYLLSKAGTGWNGLFFFINPSEMEKKVFRPMTTYIDINTGRSDTKQDGFLGAHSFAWGHPDHLGEINGVTAYS